jgi:2-alkyl-3-oxoalkanoate reductase
MQQHVLIIGADNFVGRKLSARLNDDGLTAVSLPTNATKGKIAAALNQASAVVSCTTGSAKAIELSAQNLFAAIRTASITHRVVHVSSMTVYGSVEGDIDENATINPRLGGYAAARVAAENLASDCSDVVTLRPGCEYGPEATHWSSRVALCLKHHQVGDLGVAGDGYCNLLYIDDLVTAIIQSLKMPGIAGQVFNLCSPESLTWNEYFIQFAKVLGAVPVRRITKRNLAIETKLLAVPRKIAELLLGKRTPLAPALPPSALGLFRQELRLNPTKATQMLGIQWTPITNGLIQTAEWIKTQKQ